MDFWESPILVGIYDVLFAVVAFTFFLKRWRRFQMKKEKIASQQANGESLNGN
jgi:uncharacterized membrane protein